LTSLFGALVQQAKLVSLFWRRIRRRLVPSDFSRYGNLGFLFGTARQITGTRPF